MMNEGAYQKKLAELAELIGAAESFFEVMPEIESSLCSLLQSERVTVYSRGRHNREIVSKYKSGDDVTEIRVPLSTSSIAGYVALSQQPVLFRDVYNETELRSVAEDLRFNRSFDEKSGFRTRSVVGVPIKSGDVLLGVLQLVNRVGGDFFVKEDLDHAQDIAKIIGEKFRYELRGTTGPFDYLVSTKRITRKKIEELEARAERDRVPVVQLLMSEDGISKAEIGESMEHYYQVPFVPYNPDLRIPPELLDGINPAYLQQQVWAPISGHRDGEVTILIDNPNDAQRIMEIQKILPARQYAFQVAFTEDILRYLGGGGGAEEEKSNISELVDRLHEEAGGIEVIEDYDDEPSNDEATVIQLVNKLITDSYRERASDIHIEPSKGKSGAQVRIRVDGAMRSAFSIPHSHVPAVVSRIKIMSGLDISERRKPQDGKCAIRYRGAPIELRVATVPTVHGESVVMRILASSEPLPLNKLNFSERTAREVERIVAQPHGVFLVVGPTGSGKTTTLHAILGHINTPDRKIWTAEDPVEITQPGLSQVQMKPEIGLNFASALRSFLRADPDVIMIGEMRDHETAHIGVEASLTGHFVFSTLHTNSAPETVTRLLDLGLDPVSFSDALQGVLAQRLVRTLCSKCKQPYKIPEDEFTLLQRYYGEEYFEELGLTCNQSEIFRAKGCDYCGDTGYRGRTGIHELLVNSAAIRSLIYKKAGAQEIKTVSLQEGMRTLMQDGIRKLTLGETDLSQVRKVAGS
ncbi:MAG: Flp pilus assembly complex ATPase component TadA [Bdellovibrionales bacterium]|nr:Flp pilus assembly complex ATPase component TadA [Bdellovibrionales bacterium]